MIFKLCCPCLANWRAKNVNKWPTSNVCKHTHTTWTTRPNRVRQFTDHSWSWSADHESKKDIDHFLSVWSMCLSPETATLDHTKCQHSSPCMKNRPSKSLSICKFHYCTVVTRNQSKKAGWTIEGTWIEHYTTNWNITSAAVAGRDLIDSTCKNIPCWLVCIKLGE